MKTTALAFAAVLIAIVLITGATYEQAERARDRDRLPQIGRSIDIGGRSLNIDCAGSGSPTVIFETGAPRPGYSWVFIQGETVKFTRACWYDRAGFGWSDLGPYPRTSDASARDLHALLQRASISPPYVLVPETLAVFDARVYTGLYPAEVAGMVMVDGVHPDLFKRLPQIRAKSAPIQKYIGYPQNIAARLFNEIGLMRLISTSRRTAAPPPPGVTPEQWQTIWRLTNRPQSRVALLQELPAIDQSITQARAAGDLGARPLRVISQTSDREAASDQQIGLELQADLVRLSSRGKQILVLPQTSGFLVYQSPHVVIDAIHEVVLNLRQPRP
jgi:pimeloyl-ACP methyl ester carboxylesterase